MASWFDFVVFFMLISTITEGKIDISQEEGGDLEIERQLKVLNKKPVKSFKKKDGSIVDCIDIHKQPAFDHPLLRNHTIQLRPSSQTREMLAAKPESIKTSRRKGVNCPSGTVPIRRTTKEDLVRAKSDLSRMHPSLSSFHTLALDNRGHHFATVHSNIDPDRVYFGIEGSVSVHNQTVTSNQHSGAGFWIVNNLKGQKDAIHYGWIVYPGLYGDHKTRTVSFWNANYGKAGCYNLLCPGFVQVSSRHHLGEEIKYQSEYDGSQYWQQIEIIKDSGKWWVTEFILDEGYVEIGYWPDSLFTSTGLAAFASELHFGGEVYSAAAESLPTMGSGHFEPPNFERTGFISRIKAAGMERRAHKTKFGVYTDLPNCYKAQHLDYTGGINGVAMMYGGPGGASCENGKS